MTVALPLGRRYYVSILLVGYSLIVPFLIKPEFMFAALGAPARMVLGIIRRELYSIDDIFVCLLIWIAFLAVPLTVYPLLVARDHRWDHWAIRCAIGFGLGWVCVLLLPS